MRTHLIDRNDPIIIVYRFALGVSLFDELIGAREKERERDCPSFCEIPPGICAVAAMYRLENDGIDFIGYIYPIHSWILWSTECVFLASDFHSQRQFYANERQI